MSLYDQHKDTAISLVTESVVVCTVIYFVQVHVYYIIKQGIALKVHCKVQCKYPWTLRWIMNCGWLIYNKLIYTWFLSGLYLLSIGGQSQSWCHQQQHFASFFYIKTIDLMLLHICSLEHVDCWRHHNAVKTSSTNLPAACMPPRAV